jgi:hypothetical protein
MSGGAPGINPNDPKPRHDFDASETAGARAALESSLDQITWGAATQKDAAEKVTAQLESTDMCMTKMIRCTGLAGKLPEWSEVTVKFPNPLLMAVGQGQYDGTALNPHFTVGVEMLLDSEVLIDAMVRHWIQDDSSFYTGCIVKVCAWAPAARKQTPFDSIVHLGFMGFGAPVAEEPETPEEPDPETEEI